MYQETGTCSECKRSQTDAGNETLFYGTLLCYSKFTEYLSPIDTLRLGIPQNRSGTKKRDSDLRILMLGNSFPSANEMPQMLAGLTADAAAHTRGRTRLSEHLNPRTRLGARAQAALRET